MRPVIDNILLLFNYFVYGAMHVFQFHSLTHTTDLYTMHAMKQEEFLEKLDINVTKTDINIAKGQPIA